MLAFFVVHVVVWIGLVGLVPGSDRVDYELLGDASTPWVRQFVVALLAVLLVQIVVISRENMWSEVLRDRTRSTRTWMLVPPIVVVCLGIIGFLDAGLSDAPTSYWVGMTSAIVLVGITEELTFRGILVAGGRRSGWGEGRIMVVSSALFGLFHLPNWFLGQDFSKTIVQVAVTAVIGSAFYALRRRSGSIIPCVLLHAAYDWLLIQGSFA